MREKTKAELVEAVGSAGTSLLKELFSRQQEMNMMEQRAQMQKELAQAKAGTTPLNAPDTSTSAQGRDSVIETLQQAETEASEYDELLQRAEEMESCELCTKLIRGARARPMNEQAELLTALREFFASVEDDTPTEQVAAQMRQHDTLMEVVQSEIHNGASA